MGSYIRVIAADGTVTCQADAAGPANAFVQGGNAFGAVATLGTNDNNAVEISANGSRAMRLEPNAESPNVIGGSPVNSVPAGVSGATIAGGGRAGSDCLDPVAGTPTRTCRNVAGYWAAIGGGQANYAVTLSTVGGGSSNNVSAAYGVVGGGAGNRVSGEGGTVGGGKSNDSASLSTTVGGGERNTANMPWATVGGGEGNTGSDNWATVAGGANNTASGQFSALGGGLGNVTSGNVSTVGGGDHNTANGTYSTVGGGEYNTASGRSSTVGGGQSNTASGNYSWASGRRAKALADGCFTWADSVDLDFACNVVNAFFVRSMGGVRIFGPGNWDVANTEGDLRIGNDTHRLKFGIALDGGGMGDAWVRAHGGIERFNIWAPGGTRVLTNAAGTTGVTIGAGAGSWSTLSDRNAKRDFETVDTRDVLERVAAMPVYRWRYAEERSAAAHMGPVAQDFRAAFGLGDGDRTIATVDADGVALAAIKGLNAKVDAQAATLAARDGEITDLRTQIGLQREQIADQRATIVELQASHGDVAALRAAVVELLRERAGGVSRARLAPATP